MVRTPGNEFPLETKHTYNSRQGVTPGKKGSALITVHAYASKPKQAEANRLPGVQVGDIVRITKPDGTVLSFKVTSVNLRAPHDLTEALQRKLRSHLGPARVAIYTCNSRTFDADEYEYQDGVVIIAKLTH